MDPMQAMQMQQMMPPGVGDAGDPTAPEPAAGDPGDPQEGQEPQEPQSQPDPSQMPPQAPVDPISAAMVAILSMPGPEAIRRVYQLATSAATAKAKLRDAAAAMDALTYHAALSASPEAKYATELIDVRRELDTLAQERRRLNLEAGKARASGKASSAASASIYELQSTAVTAAMEQVAGGMLMFLALPGNALDPQPMMDSQPSDTWLSQAQPQRQPQSVQPTQSPQPQSNSNLQ